MTTRRAVTLAFLTCMAAASPLAAALAQRTGADPPVMRAPSALYQMGPRDPGWSGRVVLGAQRLDLEFPLVAADNVGCAAVDSVPSRRRRYYWIATAEYPDSHYPDNHFQSAALDFELAADDLPTARRLDSAVHAMPLRMSELAGDPPLEVRAVPLSSRAQLRSVGAGAARAWRVSFAITDTAALRAFRRPGAASVSLGWCQRDQWLTSLKVPLERR